MKKKPLKLTENNSLPLALGVLKKRFSELNKICYQSYKNNEAVSEMINQIYIQLDDAAEILYCIFHLAVCLEQMKHNTKIVNKAACSTKAKHE